MAAAAWSSRSRASAEGARRYPASANASSETASCRSRQTVTTAERRSTSRWESRIEVTVVAATAVSTTSTTATTALATATVRLVPARVTLTPSFSKHPP